MERVDADHFAFHLVERQRSAVLERLRQIERRIRRLSDKMGVIHLVPRFGIYAMRPEEDVRRACELANLALGAARGSADNTVAFYQDLDQNAFFENMQLEDRFDEAIGEHQFKAYYQPKCNPKTGEIVGGERNDASRLSYDFRAVLGSNISENVDFTLSWHGAYNIAKNSLVVAMRCN